MVEVEVPEEAGSGLTLNYGGHQVTYAPADGVVMVEDHHLDLFLGAVPGARRYVAPAQPAEKPAKSSAKPAPKE